MARQQVFIKHLLLAGTFCYTLGLLKIEAERKTSPPLKEFTFQWSKITHKKGAEILVKRLVEVLTRGNKIHRVRSTAEKNEA